MAGALHGVIASLAGRITDAFFRYVSLLLNTTSTNGAQNNTFLDSSTNAFSVTRNGNTTQGTFSPFSQTGWSNYFDGTGDWLTSPASTATTIGSGDFTFECWCYANNWTNAVVPLFTQWDGSTVGGFWVGKNGSNFVLRASGVGDQLTYATLPATNQWVHIAVTRSGTTARMFYDGVQVASGTVTYSFANVRNVIGSDGDPTTPANFTGYISNARIVKGTAVYTSNFTPPTSPLTNITNTSLLTCQSNRFIDNSSNAFAITRNGDVSVQAFSPFNPTAAWSASTNGGSGYFDGTGDYLSVARNNAFLPVANEDFTIEAWVYLTATPSAQNAVVAGLGEYGLDSDWDFNINSSLQVGFYINIITTEYRNTTTPITLNSWNHVAVSRSGTGTNNLRVYVNGVGQSFTTNSTTVGTGLRNLTIGADQNGDEAIATGYISNFRLVKGTAVYTANFTPPTAPLTAITNTSLLLNFTNAGIFDSASGNNLETVGNAQVSTTVAKWGTTSMAFDGTGDWLLNIDKPALRLGTAAFTIEMWVYRSASGTYGLVSKGTSTTGWSVSLNASNQVVFSFTTSSITSTGTVAATTWTHIAVVREGTGTNQTKIYINGTNDGTGTVATDFNQTNAMYVGADRVAGGAFNGYIDDLRITNGISRYTANFTAPTAAFPLQ